MKRYIYLFLMMLLLFWSGGVKGQGGVSYELTLQVVPAGIGSVTGGGMYAAGASVNVRTSLNSGNGSFKFKSWNEGNTVVSTVANFTFSMPERACILTAVYEYDPNNPGDPGDPEDLYNLNLQISPKGAGTVSGAGRYAAGAVRAVSVSGSAGFRFQSWKEGDSIVSAAASFNYVMPARNVTFTAIYTYDPNNPGDPDMPDIPETKPKWALFLEAQPKGGGTFNITSGTKYEEGQTVALRANPSTGFRFIEWRDGTTVLSSNQNFNYTTGRSEKTLTAVFSYDPNNPGEPNTPDIKPRSALFLEVQPKGSGSINITSGTRYEEGQSVALRATPNTGFRFIEWRDGTTVLSSSQNFNYTMGDSEKTLTAVFSYDPGNPGEPGTSTNVEHGLIALTQYGDKGQNITFPIYLLNHNLSVHSVEFDIAFPDGVTVDYANAVLLTRKNGHTVSAAALGNNKFRYSIRSNPQADFSGSNGILISIPLKLPTTWTSSETYPVRITNVVLGAPGETIQSTARPGALGINGATDNSVVANFYSSKFLNRVSFINLSSEAATGFAWDFGDGTTSTEKSPLHIFNFGGTYDVRLIAFNASRRDTVINKVEINPANTWMLSGTVSLNKHNRDLKNFTSVRELFQMLSQVNIDGNITILVESGETFDWNLSSGEESWFTVIRDKLSARNSKLIFLKDGAATRPVIHFAGAISVPGYSALIGLSRWMETDQVEIKILGQTINLQRIHSNPSQQVCSGTASGEVDFTEISAAFSYNWSLVTSPAAIAGYTVSGSGRIPKMTLTNTSTRTDSLRYKVSMMYAPSSSTPAELYTFEYKIFVLPALQGELKLSAPTNGEILNNSTVTLRWNSIANAYYDLYAYEEYDDEPATPTVSQINRNYYESSTLFRNGKTYKCKVVAVGVGECSRKESETISFTIRNLPNLHVTSIDIPENTEAGSEIEVIYRVKNDGQGATLAGEQWNERVGIVQSMQNPTAIQWLAEKRNKSALNAGASYLDTLKVTLPERLLGKAYLVVTCNMGNILSIDWAPVGNTVPVPYTPNTNGVPYPYLKAQIPVNSNRMPEEGEANMITDNFFYAEIGLSLQKLPDLTVTAVEAPTSAMERSVFTVKAKISNTGEARLAGKTWSDGIYCGKTPEFNPITATLVAVTGSSHVLNPGESYEAVFQVTAPVDSLADNYFFVTADIDDDVYESNNGNNRFAAVSIRILPYMMNESDYQQLKAIYNGFEGSLWKDKWNTSSMRIGNYWPGVTFENGRVTGISVPGNRLAGELSGVFLKFPYLTVLNLNDNLLTGSLSALLADANLPASLVTLNLGKNRLEGNIPASISKLTGLTNLDLSYNRLTSLDEALPSKITDLNLQYQTSEPDSTVLSVRSVLNVPSIALYNHTDRSFNSYPSYGLYAANDFRFFGYVSENNNQYKWDLSPVNERNFEWKYDSGLEFTLVQETGLTKGTSRPFKIRFKTGDANIDNSVNIFDVQHTLNYIFKRHVSAFNFAAADTYKDNLITVQDIIRSVQIILNPDEGADGSPGNTFLRSDVETNNTLSIEDGQLVLFLEEEAVAMMDIRFEGTFEKDISPLLDDTKFQFAFRDSETGTRLIILSFTRDAIFPGRTAIAGIRSANARLVEVTASNLDAQPVLVRISSVITGTVLPETGNIRVFAENGIVYCDLPWKADRITATLYTLQGIAVGKQLLKDVPPGKHPLIFNVGGSPDNYILSLDIKAENRNTVINNKLLLKK